MSADQGGDFVKVELAGALRFQAKAASIVPTASGDGRIIARLLIASNDPAARLLCIELAPEALAGVIRSAQWIEQCSRDGSINHIARDLDLATQIDEAPPPDNWWMNDEEFRKWQGDDDD